MKQFTLTETEARALHDLIAELSLNEHRKLLANPSLGKPLYNGSIEDAHEIIYHVYGSLHNVLAI